MSIKTEIANSRILPKTMKVKLEKLITTSSKYNKGIVTGLKKPSELNKISSKARSVSFGADKKGFFVYTHRARSKSKSNWKNITKKEIDFIESTG